MWLLKSQYYAFSKKKCAYFSQGERNKSNVFKMNFFLKGTSMCFKETFEVGLL